MNSEIRLTKLLYSTKLLDMCEPSFSHTTICCHSKEFHYHMYKVVQELKELDYLMPIHYCRWLQNFITTHGQAAFDHLQVNKKIPVSFTDNKNMFHVLFRLRLMPCSLAPRASVYQSCVSGMWHPVPHKTAACITRDSISLVGHSKNMKLVGHSKNMKHVNSPAIKRSW